MIEYICRDYDFDKRIEMLLYSGGAASAAARKAQTLTANIQKSGILEGAGKLTKYGEARLKNCLKFDLGNGYRLVCAREQTRLYLRFIGTHDECDRWIRQRTGETRDHILSDCPCKALLRNLSAASSQSGKITEQPQDQYEELIEDKLDDRLLVKIFSGLALRGQSRHH